MRKGSLAVALVVVSLLAAACGNSGDDTKDSTSAPSVPPTEPGDTTTTADLTTNVPVDEKGVTDTEIRFSSISTINGNPLGTDIGNAYNAGIEAYFEWRNSQGGIWGRDLVLANKRDDQLGNNQVEAQAMIAQDDSIGAFVATLLFSGAADLDDAGVPTFGWGIHAEFGGKSSLFGHVGVICFGCEGKAIPYIAQQVGATKVAALGYNVENSAKCVEGTELSFDAYGADAGAELVYSDNTLAFGLPAGLAPQVSEMKDKGVDLISTCMDLNGAKTLAEELDKQGMGDVPMVHPNTYVHPFVRENADLFEGDFVSAQFTPFEYDIDSEIADAFFEYTDADSRNELTMVGWINADAAYTALKMAGPEFSRAKMISAFNTSTEYSAGGLIVPIDWTKQHADPKANPESRSPYECFAPVRVAAGEFEQYGGNDEAPWLCFDRNSEGLDEPTLTNFAPEG
jgi:ABC-type branched-subunit amino acid transport system substrate-binding protein